MRKSLKRVIVLLLCVALLMGDNAIIVFAEEINTIDKTQDIVESETESLFEQSEEDNSNSSSEENYEELSSSSTDESAEEESQIIDELSCTDDNDVDISLESDFEVELLGAGTIDAPYRIANKAEFEYFFELINKYSYDYRVNSVDVYYAISCDIDFENTQFCDQAMIGRTDFKAHLLGKSHTIYNLVFDTYQSLFHELKASASVSDITFCNVKYTHKSGAGFLALVNNGSIENVNLDGDILVKKDIGNAYLGGLVYTNKGRIAKCAILPSCNISFSSSSENTMFYFGGLAYENYIQTCTIDGEIVEFFSECRNDGIITVLENNYRIYCGGIVYSNYGDITNCQFKGKLLGESKIQYYSFELAGITRINNVDGTISDCKAESGTEIITKSTYAGIVLDNRGMITECNNASHVKYDDYENTVVGICKENKGEILSCNNEGDIKSTYYASGIVYNNKGLVSNCMNRGNISGQYVGGIAVFSSYNSYDQADTGIFYCENYGRVESENSGFAGGIIGKLLTTKARNNDAGTSDLYYQVVDLCKNEGIVRGKEAGGIVGEMGAPVSMSLISNCTNNGKISAFVRGGYAGGIIGFVNTPEVYNETNRLVVKKCINTGHVSGSTAGGISAIWKMDTIEGCCNIGIVNGEKVGGIIGVLWEEKNYVGEIINSYNLGDIKGVLVENEPTCYVGGIVGYLNGGVIYRCYNAGDVSRGVPNNGKSPSSCDIGGIAGWMSNSVRISDCFNIGKIIGDENDRIGGAVGCIMGSSVVNIANCYVMGAEEVATKYDDNEIYKGGVGLAIGAIFMDTETHISANELLVISNREKHNNIGIISYPYANEAEKLGIRNVSDLEIKSINSFDSSWNFCENYDEMTRDGWTFLKGGTYKYPVLINVGMNALENIGNDKESFDSSTLLDKGQFIIRVRDEDFKAVPNAIVEINNTKLYSNSQGNLYYPISYSSKKISISKIVITKNGYETYIDRDIEFDFDDICSTSFVLKKKYIENTVPELVNVDTSFTTGGPSVNVDGDKVNILEFPNYVDVEMSSTAGPIKMVTSVDRAKEELKIAIMLEDKLSNIPVTDLFERAKSKTCELERCMANLDDYPKSKKGAWKVESTISTKAEISGYAVISLKDNQVKESGLCFVGSASDSMKFYKGLYWTKYTLKGKLGGKFKWERDEYTNNVSPIGEINLNAQFEAAIGVGIDLLYAQGAVTGEFNTKITVPFETPKESINATISGEIKTELSLFGFKTDKKFKISQEIYPETSTKILFNGEEIEVQSKSMDEIFVEEFVSDDNKVPVSRGYLVNTWDTFTLNSEDSTYELKNVYPEGRVQYCKLNDGTQIVVWLHDFGTKSSSNRTTIAYSLNSGSGWSEPRCIYETGRGDYYPNLYSDGTNTMVVWNNAKKAFDGDVTIDELEDNMEIYSSIFDSVEGRFLSPKLVPCNSDGKMKIAPKTIVNDGRYAITWIENSSNDILMRSGTNDIFCIEFKDGRWSDKVKVAENIPLVAGYDLEYVNGQLNVAYAVREKISDDNYKSFVYLYCGGNLKTIPGINGIVTDVDFAGNNLYFCQNDAVKVVQIDNPSYIYHTGVFADVISVEENERGNDVILYLEANGLCSDIYASFEKYGRYSKPLKMLSRGTKIGSFDVVYNNNETLDIAANEMEMSMDSVGDVSFGNTNLIITGGTKAEQFSIDSILTYDSFDVKEGNCIEFTANAFNGTRENINELRAILKVDGTIVKEESISTSISSGESKEISISYTLPNSICKQNYTLTIIPIGFIDVDSSDNVAECELGYGNLCLENLELSGGVLSGSVVNNGYSSINIPRIVVRKDTQDGDLICTIEKGGTLYAGEKWDFSYDSSGKDSEELVNDDGYVIFHITAESMDENEIEQNYGDNTDICSKIPVLADIINIKDDNLVIAQNTCRKIEAELISESGKKVDIDDITYHSEDYKVAVVDSDGYVIGVGEGNTIVHVINSASNLDVSVNVTVTKGDDASFNILKKTLGLYKGESSRLSVVNEKGENLSDVVNWKSSDSKIIEVNQGVVEALSDGIAFVEIYDGDYITDAFVLVCIVQVIDKEIREIYVGDTSIVIEKNAYGKIDAIVIPDDTTQDKDLIYESTDESIVQINSDGSYYGVNPGITTIIISSKANPEIKSSVNVSVMNGDSDVLQYAIDFDCDGGSEVERISGIEKGCMVELPIPSKSGMLFDGWYTEPDGRGTRYTDATPITSIITLYAKWVIPTYTVVFDSQGGDAIDSVGGISVGNTIEMPTPTKEKLSFMGWYTEPDGKGTHYTSETPILGNITLYAKWGYTIRFDSQGGSEVRDIIVTENGVASGIFITPTKGDLYFGGWFSEPNGQGDRYKYWSQTSSDITLYAYWCVPKEAMSFVYYEKNDGSLCIIGTSLTGDVDLIIPEEIDGHIVTSIGEDAFKDCREITGKLIISNSVISIGNSAFENCAGLIGDLNIPSSVTSIGESAFYGCSGFTGELTIPNGITSIESWTFCECSGLTGKLTIPEGVSFIGDLAFYGCSGFTGELTIPNGVTSIEFMTFYGCSGLTGELIIPNSVTYIDNCAFGNCSSFTGKLIIPGSVVSIGNSAFFNCSGFSDKLIIQNGVSFIDGFAFEGCSAFSGDLIIPASVKQIGDCAFLNCSGFKDKLIIPNSITSISKWAFENCSGFMYVKNSSNVKLELPTTEGNIWKDSTGKVITSIENGVAIRSDYIDGPIEPGDIEKTEGFWIKLSDNTSSEDGKYYYSSKQIKPDIMVYDGKEELTFNKDYTYTIKNNINVGIATITVRGKGNYDSVETVEFKIQKKDISSDEFVADQIVLKFTGRDQKPKPVFKWNGKVVPTAGYKYAYYKADEDGNPTGDALTAVNAVGEYVIVISGQGNFTGTRNVMVTVTNNLKDASKLTVAKIVNQPYTGEAIEPTLTVSDGRNPLTLGKDYEVEYIGDHISVGTATVIIRGKGNYIGVKRVTFNITGTPITKATVENLPTSVIYKGTDYTVDDFSGLKLYIKATTKTAEISLTESDDYEVSYLNNKKLGTATVVFTGINGYTGVLKKTFRITQYKLADDTEGRINVTADSSVEYSKGGAKPKVVVTYKDADGTTDTLAEKTDYILSYTNNTAVNDGSNPSKLPTVKVTFKGNYQGTASANYVIIAKKISKTDAVAVDKVYANRAGAYKSAVTLTDKDGKKLAANKDYESNVTYKIKGSDTPLDAKSIVDAGTTIVATITAKEGGNYTGSTTCEYRVTQASINAAVIKTEKKTYTGKAIELVPETDIISAKIGTKVDLVYGTDYEIVPGSYLNHTKKGTASFMIRGLNNYGGTKKVTFTIKAKGFSWWWR